MEDYSYERGSLNLALNLMIRMRKRGCRVITPLGAAKGQFLLIACVTRNETVQVTCTHAHTDFVDELRMRTHYRSVTKQFSNTITSIVVIAYRKNLVITLANTKILLL